MTGPLHDLDTVRVIITCQCGATFDGATEDEAFAILANHADTMERLAAEGAELERRARSVPRCSVCGYTLTGDPRAHEQCVDRGDL